MLKYAWIALLAACYTYRPLSLPEPDVGRRVSVQLTDDGSRDLASQIGPNVLHVEGNVLQVDSGGLALSVRQVEDARGVQSGWRGERVTVPRRSVAGIQERRLSPGATGLMGGLVIVGLVALYNTLGGGDLFEGSSGSGGGQGQ